MAKWLDAPTGPGWWIRCRRLAYFAPVVVQIEDDSRLGLKMVGGNLAVKNMDKSLWHGPIVPPEMEGEDG